MSRRKFIWAVFIAAGVALAGVCGVYVAGRILTRGAGPRLAHAMLPGEQLEYEVSSSWLGRGGTVVAETSPRFVLEDGTAAHAITFTLRTNPVLAAVYVLKGQLRVVVESGSLLPREFEEEIVRGLGITGGRPKHTKFVYDQVRHTLAYYKERDSRLVLRRTREGLPPQTHHFLSLLFYLRGVSLTAGQTIEVPMSSPKRDIVLRLTVLGDEEYAAPAGERRKGIAIDVTVARTLGDEDDDDEKDDRLKSFRVLLDKEGRYPVRLDVEVALGTMSAQLIRRTLAEGTPPKSNESRRNHTGAVRIDPPSGESSP